MSPRRFGLALILTCFLPSAAAGAVAVFADPGGVNNGEVQLPEEPGQVLELYLELGSVDSGNACRQGSVGDEVCGYRVGIRIEGNGFIESFSGASAGVKSWPQDFVSAPVRDLTVAYVIDAATASPSGMSPAPLHIGTLTVDASDGARVLVTGHAAIDAGLGKRSIPSDTLAATPLPEPGALAQWVSGLCALALLARLRRR